MCMRACVHACVRDRKRERVCISYAFMGFFSLVCEGSGCVFPSALSYCLACFSHSEHSIMGLQAFSNTELGHCFKSGIISSDCLSLYFTNFT